MWGLRGRPGRKFLKTFRASESGAPAIEFAMVAGPFFFVLGCICETGLMLFTEYVLQNSVQEAARTIRTGQAQTTGVTADQFKALICDQVNIIIDCTGKVTVYVNNDVDFAALDTKVPDPINIGTQNDGSSGPASYQPGDRLRTAAVIATYDWDFAFPFMDFLGNIANGQKRRLWGMAIFRNEPF
jgi:Flp pilus assembly protein TadG